MEYAIGPLVALLISMKFTTMQVQARESRLKFLESRIEQVDGRVEEMDKQVLENSMKIMLPLANATRKIQEQLGMWAKWFGE